MTMGDKLQDSFGVLPVLPVGSQRRELMTNIQPITDALSALAGRVEYLARRCKKDGDLRGASWYSGFATGVTVAIDVLAAVDPAASAAGWYSVNEDDDE
jgi:hypothetical protein